MLFSDISLVELNVVQKIVIFGFETIYVTLDAITIVITAADGSDFYKIIEK
jgi:hypothetical protein